MSNDQLNDDNIPKSHGAYKFEDINKCPYSQKIKAKLANKGKKIDFKEKKRIDEDKVIWSEDEPSTEDDDPFKPKNSGGGCPVMNNSSNIMKNCSYKIQRF